MYASSPSSRISYKTISTSNWKWVHGQSVINAQCVDNNKNRILCDSLVLYFMSLILDRTKFSEFFHVHLYNSSSTKRKILDM